MKRESLSENVIAIFLILSFLVSALATSLLVSYVMCPAIASCMDYTSLHEKAESISSFSDLMIISENEAEISIEDQKVEANFVSGNRKLVVIYDHDFQIIDTEEMLAGILEICVGNLALILCFAIEAVLIFAYANISAKIEWILEKKRQQ